MNDIQTLARMYLDAQQTRIGAEHRIRKLSQANKTIDVTDLEDIVETQKNVEKEILDLVKKKSEGHLLWTWAKENAGIGEVGVMTFLGYINPFIADTAGKAKAYLGLTPNHGLKKGLNHKCNFEAKGRFYGVVLHGVIMAKHSKKKSTFYYDYYQNAKAYYANHPKVLALTKGQKGYIDNLAKRKTLALIVSHGTQLMREYEGLDTTAFKAHHRYIPPIISEPCVKENKRKERANEYREQVSIASHETKRTILYSSIILFISTLSRRERIENILNVQ